MEVQTKLEIKVIKLEGGMLDLAGSLVRSYIAFGEGLCQLKEELPHGEFIPWCDKHLRIKRIIEEVKCGWQYR